jgi:transketolase
MRKQFAEILHEIMLENPKIVVIVGDVGFGVFDQIRQDFPDRFYNAGASEQLMLGMAVGLALEGYVPVAYTITPFLLYRPFEFIRNYLNHEKIPVKLVGAGRNDDYSRDGFTHHAFDDVHFLNLFPNITQIFPVSLTKSTVEKFISSSSPAYMNLTR